MFQRVVLASFRENVFLQSNCFLNYEKTHFWVLFLTVTLTSNGFLILNPASLPSDAIVRLPRSGEVEQMERDRERPVHPAHSGKSGIPGPQIRDSNDPQIRAREPCSHSKLVGLGNIICSRVYHLLPPSYTVSANSKEKSRSRAFGCSTRQRGSLHLANADHGKQYSSPVTFQCFATTDKLARFEFMTLSAV